MKKLKRNDKKLLKMESGNQNNIDGNKLKSDFENLELPYINNSNKLERKGSNKIERLGSNHDDIKESKVKRAKTTTRRLTTHSKSQKFSIFDTEQDVYNKN